MSCATSGAGEEVLGSEFLVLSERRTWEGGLDEWGERVSEF